MTPISYFYYIKSSFVDRLSRLLRLTTAPKFAQVGNRVLPIVDYVKVMSHPFTIRIKNVAGNVMTEIYPNDKCDMEILGMSILIDTDGNAGNRRPSVAYGTPDETGTLQSATTMPTTAFLVANALRTVSYMPNMSMTRDNVSDDLCNLCIFPKVYNGDCLIVQLIGGLAGDKYTITLKIVEIESIDEYEKVIIES